MPTPKEAVTDALNRAKADLDEALFVLEALSPLDPDSINCTAHALNNYLTVAGGTVDLLKAALAGHPEEQVGRWLNGLGHATTLMAHAVSQLMNNAATSAPKYRRDRADVGRLLRRVAEYYAVAAGRKGIRVAVEIAEDLPDVTTDAVAVAAVLDNFLSNAVKFSPTGTGILVTGRSVAGHVVLSVRDEGPGLGPEDRAKLFRKGERLRPAPTAGEPSSGYGLAVAREIATNLGAEIGCESERGKGATFFLRLPLSP